MFPKYFKIKDLQHSAGVLKLVIKKTFMVFFDLYRFQKVKIIKLYIFYDPKNCFKLDFFQIRYAQVKTTLLSSIISMGKKNQYYRV